MRGPGVVKPKERGIVFGAWSVRAILSGSKTQTRRVIPVEWFRCLDPENTEDRAAALKMCPHGATGDRLWVRETFVHFPDAPPKTLYRADAEQPEKGVGWKSPRFMPRARSRLTLELTEVQIQRLQDITEDDAKAEGIPPMQCTVPTRMGGLVCDASKPDFRGAFAQVWDLINGKRPGCSWEANPWVWALSFKQVKL